MNLSQVQCNSFVMQQNMSNPEEHCNLGFHSLVVDEGGAFHYSVRLGVKPPLGPVQLQVSGAHLQYAPKVIFTEKDWGTPHEITIVVAEDLKTTGNYWMDLKHTFTNVNAKGKDNTKWFTSREAALSISSKLPLGWY